MFLIFTDGYDNASNRLIIECNIKSINVFNYKIRWYKDDVEIRPSCVPVYDYSPTTYEHDYDEDTGRVRLIITYPSSNECGLYRCVIYDRSNQKIDETSHLVYKMFNPLPAIPREKLEKKNPVIFEQYLNDITAEEGSHSVRLTCKISQCSTNSTIVWYRNNEELLIEQRRDKYRFSKSYNRLYLEILNINANDAGAYECKVMNQYSEISSKCNVYVHERMERRTKSKTRGKKTLHFFDEIILNIDFFTQIQFCQTNHLMSYPSTKIMMIVRNQFPHQLQAVEEICHYTHYVTPPTIQAHLLINHVLAHS